MHPIKDPVTWRAGTCTTTKIPNTTIVPGASDGVAPFKASQNSPTLRPTDFSPVE